MLSSPFAFFRGSAALMVADLAQMPNTSIIVQACGDCHLMNFGGFASPERNLVFDINDFDETLPGPWEWDVKRLATSFILAVRENRLSKSVARRAALKCVRSYREAIRALASLDPLDLWYKRFDIDTLLRLAPSRGDRARLERRIKKATAASGSNLEFPKLGEVVHGVARIHDAPPLIFHPEPEEADDFRAISDEALKSYRASLADDRKRLLDRYRYIDAAIKVTGIGNVGRRSWVALLMSPADNPLFLQFRQANDSVLEPYAGKSCYGSSRAACCEWAAPHASNFGHISWLDDKPSRRILRPPAARRQAEPDDRDD